MGVPLRRLDDRIRAACSRLVNSNGAFEDAVNDFLTLLHGKSERLKSRAGRLLLNGEHLEGERRKSFKL